MRKYIILILLAFSLLSYRAYSQYVNSDDTPDNVNSDYQPDYVGTAAMSYSAYEDFKNDYTEVDPGTYINADTEDTRVDVVAMDMDIDAYFHKDHGANHFNAFEIHFTTAYTGFSGANTTIFGAFSVSTTLDDLHGQTDAYQVYWRVNDGSSSYALYLHDENNNNTDNTANLTQGTPYYCIALRDTTAYSLEIYSDAAHTTGVDTLNVVGTTTAFRYLEAGVSSNYGYSARSITGYVKDMDLNE